MSAERFLFGGYDDDPTGAAVETTVSAAEALTIAREELEDMDYGVDGRRQFVLRIKGKRLYRVTSEIEDRINGWHDEFAGRWVPCTTRAKHPVEFWIMDLIWLAATTNGDTNA